MMPMMMMLLLLVLLFPGSRMRGHRNFGLRLTDSHGRIGKSNNFFFVWLPTPRHLFPRLPNFFSFLKPLYGANGCFCYSGFYFLLPNLTRRYPTGFTRPIFFSLPFLAALFGMCVIDCKNGSSSLITPSSTNQTDFGFPTNNSNLSLKHPTAISGFCFP